MIKHGNQQLYGQLQPKYHTIKTHGKKKLEFPAWESSDKLPYKFLTTKFKHITPNFVSQQPRMPHAIATRMSYIWYNADRREQQWKRATWSVFFCQGRRTGASAENVSRPMTDLQRGQQQMGIYNRKNRKRPIRCSFSVPAASRCSKACLYNDSRKYSKN